MKQFVTELRGALAACGHQGRLASVHRHFTSLESTNDYALEWLDAHEPPGHGALVTAEAQTGGRGRLGRRWQSPAGAGVYASVIVAPGTVSHGLGPLSLVVGLALAEGLERCCPALTPQLKWPNDLMVSHRKLGGILCECRWQGERPRLVIGFGINLRARPLSAPLLVQATSLQQELESGASEAPSVVDVLAAVLPALEARLLAFFRAGFASARTEYLARSELQGRVVYTAANATTSRSQAFSDQPPVYGAPHPEPALPARRVVIGLDVDGALLVRKPNGGPAERIQSADVWLAPESEGPRG